MMLQKFSKFESCLFDGAVALRHGSQHVGFDVQKWQQVEWNFSARLYPFQVFRKLQNCNPNPVAFFPPPDVLML